MYRPSSVARLCALNLGSALNPRTLNPGTTALYVSLYASNFDHNKLKKEMKNESIEVIGVVLMIHCMHTFHDKGPYIKLLNLTLNLI